MNQPHSSLVGILQWRAKNQPGDLAYRYLADGELDEVMVTYEALDRKARSIGALLQAHTNAGDRALLLYPPGPDFIAAYFGCLYAKVLAIPAYPPHPARLERTIPVILRVAEDAKPAVALLNTVLFDVLHAQKAIMAEFGNIKFLVTDHQGIENQEEQWQQPDISTNDLAFLQYTSGSTSKPRGVMISHANLLHNMSLISQCFGVSQESNALVWLPPYHDMGLIGGILQPIYSGIPVTLMPHLLFLQRPFRWLEAISRYRATHSGAPNFAYDLCIKKIKPEQREQLDLSTWEVAFNGAEPVFHKTLDQFAEYFAPCGFRKEAFLPCYGLAESTLIVVGTPKNRVPLTKNLETRGLEQNKVIITNEATEDTRTLVSSGIKNEEQKILIVNPETHALCPPGEIGEIWITGPSVAQGYWEKPSDSEFTFGARIAGYEKGPFLRSGDLGFWHEGELYVTGRLKSLIISEGKNHYPHDIERTVEASHPAIRTTGCAVFSIYGEGKEHIVVVAEIEHRALFEPQEVLKAIRDAVSVHHGLQLHDIRLVKPGGVPKTTSGKTRHFLCKEYYLTGALNEIENIRNTQADT